MVKCGFFRKLKFLKIQKIKTKDLFQDNIQHFFFGNGNWIYFKNRVISAQPKWGLKSKISFSLKIFKNYNFWLKIPHFQVQISSTLIQRIIFEWQFRIFNSECYIQSFVLLNHYIWATSDCWISNFLFAFQIFFIWIFEFSFSLEKIPNFWHLF